MTLEMEQDRRYSGDDFTMKQLRKENEKGKERESRGVRGEGDGEGGKGGRGGIGAAEGEEKEIGVHSISMSCNRT